MKSIKEKDVNHLQRTIDDDRKLIIQVRFYRISCFYRIIIYLGNYCSNNERT